ncbi:hypothetical protein [Nostoc sp.]|uniref:hypothetical protein n=1 Tax=Nostoc sp. TaxID=1180 RepID=UPI002FF9D8A4
MTADDLSKNISPFKMTCKISFFSLRRASCFAYSETLREQVGEPAQRTGFFASLRLKNLLF